MNKQYDHIRSHRIAPHERNWKSIKDKLERRKSRQKIAFYRNLSIAAGLVAILSFVFVFSSQLPGYQQETYGALQDYIPEHLEDLPLVTNDPFYSYDKILEIEQIGSMLQYGRLDMFLLRE